MKIEKTARIFAACIVWLMASTYVEPVSAQGAPSSPWQIPREIAAQAQNLWDTYRAKQAGSGGPGREALERILSSRSLPPSRENVASVLSLLRSKVTPDEKVALTRVLGALYLGVDDPGSRTQIESYLTETASTTKDRMLGRATTLTYSRLGYFPDSLALLARARSSGFIADNDYFGEIAHLVPVAPSAEQATLVRLLDAGANGYSREILANLLKDKEVLTGLTPEAANTAAVVLGRFEPGFSDPINALGGGELLRYADWLAASVALNARISGQPERVVMVRTLRIDNVDPRKLLSALSSESISEIVRGAYGRQSLDKIDAAIAKFAAQNADNPFIQEVAGVARANLGKV